MSDEVKCCIQQIGILFNKHFNFFQLSTYIQSLFTILLYCLAFRLRISEHGPRSLSKLALSSFTQVKLSLALTVAALGLR